MGKALKTHLILRGFLILAFALYLKASITWCKVANDRFIMHASCSRSPFDCALAVLSAPARSQKAIWWILPTLPSLVDWRTTRIWNMEWDRELLRFRFVEAYRKFFIPTWKIVKRGIWDMINFVLTMAVSFKHCQTCV